MEFPGNGFIDFYFIYLFFCKCLCMVIIILNAIFFVFRYITYSKEDEAIRCIQNVHGFVLEGRSLRYMLFRHLLRPILIMVNEFVAEYLY